MIPDKIYARITAGDLDARLTPGTVFGEPYPEYIRKNALLEWAEHKIAKGTIDEWDKGYVQCLKDLIDKLNSL